MKYNDEIADEENEVHHMLFKNLTRGARVLEFGAASGRITRWMRDEYECSVSIVEFEREAYDKAIQYAADGWCGDIETYEWEGQWQGQQFDFITFTDVLEHLHNPHEVLQHTCKFLKNDGRVLISVPNVGHNDIFVKLYNNKFEYTNIGLLDNTHLHLFSKETLKDLADGTGYAIRSVEYKTVKTGSTEQCINGELQMTAAMKRLLLDRANGEVYQFVVVLEKENNRLEQYWQEDIYQDLEGWIYLDYGNGYNQENARQILGKRMSKGVYTFDIDIELDKSVQRLRIDPIEDSVCRVLRVESNLGEPRILYMHDEDYIATIDPQLEWMIEDNNNAKISLTVDISDEQVARNIDSLWVDKC